jgi:hypothetical protein
MKAILGAFALAAVLVPGTARGQFLVDSGTPDMTDNIGLFYFGPDFAQVAAQKFTLAQDATVTRIEAFMNGFGQSVPVQLVNKLGPGATAANVVTSFVLTPPHVLDPNGGTWVPADLNLCLAAGDYFLVFSSTALGVSLSLQAPGDIGSSYLASQGVDIAFPPHSAFIPIGATTLFGVRVTGTLGVAPGSWLDRGFGLAGTSGVPSLVGSGPLIGDTEGTLILRNAKPSAACLLEVSMASAPLPFKGGLLVAWPALTTVPLLTAPDGSLGLSFRWPLGLASGTSFWCQYLVSDDAAVQHVSLSNAVEATTP